MPRTTMGIYSVSTDHSNCIHDDRNDDDREQMLTISSEEFVLKVNSIQRTFKLSIVLNWMSKHLLGLLLFSGVV